MIFYVIRHGSTQLNEDGKLRGWLDVPLSSKGKKQGETLAKHFSSIPVRAIYSSPLRRASVTAQAIADANGADVIETDGLLPINFGELQGKHHSIINGDVADIFHRWETSPETPAPGGESFSDFQDRIFKFFDGLRKKDGKGDLILVTHVRCCIYLASLAMNGGSPLEGPALSMMNGIEIETGDYVSLADEDRLYIADLNILTKQSGRKETLTAALDARS